MIQPWKEGRNTGLGWTDGDAARYTPGMSLSAGSLGLVPGVTAWALHLASPKKSKAPERKDFVFSLG